MHVTLRSDGAQTIELLESENIDHTDQAIYKPSSIVPYTREVRRVVPRGVFPGLREKSAACMWNFPRSFSWKRTR